MIEQVGVEQANASQHLAVLRVKNLVVARREGNEVFYSLRDPLIGEVLDLLRRYFQARVAESQELLEALGSTGEPT